MFSDIKRFAERHGVDPRAIPAALRKLANDFELPAHALLNRAINRDPDLAKEIASAASAAS